MPAAYPRERFVGKGLRVDAYSVYARIFGDFQLFFGEGIGPAGLYGEFGRADIEGVDCGIYAGQLTFRHTERRAAANVYGVDFEVEGRKTFNLFYEAVCILLRILAHGGHRRGDERTVGTFCGAERNAHEDIGAPAPVFEVNFVLGGKHAACYLNIFVAYAEFFEQRGEVAPFGEFGIRHFCGPYAREGAPREGFARAFGQKEVKSQLCRTLCKAPVLQLVFGVPAIRKGAAYSAALYHVYVVFAFARKRVDKVALLLAEKAKHVHNFGAQKFCVGYEHFLKLVRQYAATNGIFT